ncbi:MAG: hypothetical protein AAFY29_13305 [Pseudomonadota bacterium]
MGRPLTILSFVTEQLYFNASADFSQRVGIALHAINTLLCWALIFLLARLFNARQPLLTAALVAMVWACTPQKASTVLYIVQRMASLACFFALLACVSYTVARTSTRRPVKITAWGMCLMAVLAAPFAKELGALVPFYLATMEVLIFAPLLGGRLRLPAMILLAVGLVGFAALGILEYTHAETRYAVRNFSFGDRLLSAPAVLLDYFRQFFVPDTSRLGLIHDDYPVVTNVSTLSRFWLPLALLAATVAWIARCLLNGKADLIAFGLAFFLIGHSLEGSFIPLEIYFEHRNYIPSLGLAIALLGIFVQLGIGKKQVGVYGLALSALVIFALSQAFSCWNFTERWNSRSKLLEHHLTGHPNSSRVHSEYALGLASAGRSEEAHATMQRAYDLANSEPAARSMGLGDLGLLSVVVACYAGEPLTERLAPIDGAALAYPIRTSVARSMIKMVDTNTCPDGAWDDVSAWAREVVIAGERADLPPLRFKVGGLQDLAKFERSLENYVAMYIYASMASEIQPDNAMFLLLKIEAALQLGDAAAYEEDSEQLRALVARGGLSVVERAFLEYVAPALIGLEADTEVD